MSVTVEEITLKAIHIATAGGHPHPVVEKVIFEAADIWALVATAGVVYEVHFDAKGWATSWMRLRRVR